MDDSSNCPHRVSFTEEDKTIKNNKTMCVKDLLAEPKAKQVFADTNREFGIKSNTLSTKDILCGRGVATNRYEGNENFRKFVDNFTKEYGESTKKGKMSISRAVVNHFRLQGSRFLEKDLVYNKWYDIGDKKAVEKAAQTLRDRSAMYRRKLEGEKQLEQQILEHQQQKQVVEQGEKNMEAAVASKTTTKTEPEENKNLSSSEEPSDKRASVVSLQEGEATATETKSTESAIETTEPVEKNDIDSKFLLNNASLVRSGSPVVHAVEMVSSSTKNHILSFDDPKIFGAIARSGSLSAASSRCSSYSNFSHPTMNQHKRDDSLCFIDGINHTFNNDQSQSQAHKRDDSFCFVGGENNNNDNDNNNTDMNLDQLLSEISKREAAVNHNEVLSSSSTTNMKPLEAPKALLMMPPAARILQQQQQQQRLRHRHQRSQSFNSNNFLNNSKNDNSINNINHHQNSHEEELNETILQGIFLPLPEDNNMSHGTKVACSMKRRTHRRTKSNPHTSSHHNRSKSFGSMNGNDFFNLFSQLPSVPESKTHNNNNNMNSSRHTHRKTDSSTTFTTVPCSTTSDTNEISFLTNNTNIISEADDNNNVNTNKNEQASFELSDPKIFGAIASGLIPFTTTDDVDFDDDNLVEDGDKIMNMNTGLETLINNNHHPTHLNHRHHCRDDSLQIVADSEYEMADAALSNKLNNFFSMNNEVNKHEEEAAELNKQVIQQRPQSIDTHTNLRSHNHRRNNSLGSSGMIPDFNLNQQQLQSVEGGMRMGGMTNLRSSCSSINNRATPRSHHRRTRSNPISLSSSSSSMMIGTEDADFLSNLAIMEPLPIVSEEIDSLSRASTKASTIKSMSGYQTQPSHKKNMFSTDSSIFTLEESIKKCIHHRLMSSNMSDISTSKEIKNVIFENLEELKSDLKDLPLDFLSAAAAVTSSQHAHSSSSNHVKNGSSGEFSDPELYKKIFDDVVDSVYINTTMYNDNNNDNNSDEEEKYPKINHNNNSSKEEPSTTRHRHRRTLSTPISSSNVADFGLGNLNLNQHPFLMNNHISTPKASSHRKRPSGDFSHTDFFNSLYDDYTVEVTNDNNHQEDGDDNDEGKNDSSDQRIQGSTTTTPVTITTTTTTTKKKHHHRRTHSSPLMLMDEGISTMSVMNPSMPTKRNCVSIDNIHHINNASAAAEQLTTTPQKI